jgi:hypothetical protein
MLHQVLLDVVSEVGWRIHAGHSERTGGYMLTNSERTGVGELLRAQGANHTEHRGTR